MFQKKCPNCNELINYKTKYSLSYSLKNNSKCRKCTAKSTGFTQRYATKGQSIGSDNPFFGKKHTEETKEKIRNKDYSIYKTEEFRKKISECNTRSMSGKSFYSIWLEKYGKDEADRRLKELKEKHSKNNSGSGNPMYGKPTPKGSGNGWKGWYKKHFFRSLRELTYMLMLEEEGKVWKSAENIRIFYLDCYGKERTYSPDFLVENKLIEIKPIRLQNTPLIKLKTEAGQKYCLENNLIYEIIDIKINKDLIDKYLDKIEFSENYKERYEKWNKN